MTGGARPSLGRSRVGGTRTIRGCSRRRCPVGVLRSISLDCSGGTKSGRGSPAHMHPPRPSRSHGPRPRVRLVRNPYAPPLLAGAFGGTTDCGSVDRRTRFRDANPSEHDSPSGQAAPPPPGWLESGGSLRRASDQAGRAGEEASGEQDHGGRLSVRVAPGRRPARGARGPPLPFRAGETARQAGDFHREVWHG